MGGRRREGAEGPESGGGKAKPWDAVALSGRPRRQPLVPRPPVASDRGRQGAAGTEQRGRHGASGARAGPRQPSEPPVHSGPDRSAASAGEAAHGLLVRGRSRWGRGRGTDPPGLVVTRASGPGWACPQVCTCLDTPFHPRGPTHPGQGQAKRRSGLGGPDAAGEPAGQPAGRALRGHARAPGGDAAGARGRFGLLRTQVRSDRKGGLRPERRQTVRSLSHPRSLTTDSLVTLRPS